MPAIIPFNTTQAIPYIELVRSKKPLVHCMTNDVVQNFTANILLAIGAIPAMVMARQEVADFVSVANSLLINIGTINETTAASMLTAAQSAATTNTPWVLDPVAIGDTLTYRTDIAKQLLYFKPSVIRANASEVLVLANKKSASKGPDSQDDSTSVLNVAMDLALQYKTIIAMTGKTDYVTDGDITYVIHGGNIALTQVTGMGCSLSAMVAAFTSVTHERLLAVASACFMLKKASELAQYHLGLGSFAISVIDQLSLFDCKPLSEI